MVLMDNLPDQLIWEIFSRIDKTNDQDSASLACKRFHSLENEQRKHVRVDCSLCPPANETLTSALISLCHRFPNLNKVEITYTGWKSEFGKRLDDPSLSILPNICMHLNDLTISYCNRITDAGLSSLASCSNLSSLKLNFAPLIEGSGLLPIVICCKNIKRLHLVSCAGISDLEWLECLGRQETIHDLCIKNCEGIGEAALVSHLGTWRNIKRLQFESHLGYDMFLEMIAVSQRVSCENLVELSLASCMVFPGMGLAGILEKCKNLEKVNLDMCIGARDCDIIGLAQNSKNLRAISVRVASNSSIPFRWNVQVQLTDSSLMSLAQNCTRLESVSLSVSGDGFSRLASFSLDGIASLVKTCPVKSLFLDGVHCFNNTGMEALCGADHLETLELVRCKGVTDDGLEFVARYPWLRVLRLTKCPGVTDDGLKPLIGSCKLELLVVNDCRRVSLSGVKGAAKSVCYS